MIDHFISGVVNFNHKKGCQKCVVTGTYNKEYRNMSFANLSCLRRTNDTFRDKTDESHHKLTSLLEELDVDMVMDFPTSDPLHLLELGVMKKCLLRWVFGQKGFERKLSKAHIELASRMLLKCRNQMPIDFHRKVRPLNYLRQWKGVEFRAVLLYVGLVVFKKVLDEDMYNHFVCLVCAVRICSCKSYKIYQKLAQKMFTLYIKNYVTLYGEHTIGSNIHNLSHVVEDMQESNIGNLMSISTYQFENCLRLLGLQIKHGNLPLEQVARRIIESQKIDTACSLQRVAKKCSEPRVLYEQIQTPFSKSCKIQVFNAIFIKSDVMLSNRKESDSWFMSISNEIVKLKYVIQKNNSYKIVGQNIKQKRSFFEKPIDSSKLDIYITNGEVTDELHVYGLNSVKSKMMCLSSDDEFVFLPLLHSMESLQIE